jgi:hypothetical protein
MTTVPLGEPKLYLLILSPQWFTERLPKRLWSSRLFARISRIVEDFRPEAGILHFES